MDKNKIIEEMAKIITKTYEKHGVFNPKWFAEAIYDNFFTGSRFVVLTPAEKALLENPVPVEVNIDKQFYEACKREMENIRHEKAAEILNEIANIDDDGFPMKSYAWFQKLANKNGVTIK